MIWRLRRHDPSFSSIKEKSLESRRVRTQPRTWTDGIGASLASAALTEVGPDMPEVGWGLSVRQAGCSDAALSAYEGSGAILACLRRQSAVATTKNFVATLFQ